MEYRNLAVFRLKNRTWGTEMEFDIRKMCLPVSSDSNSGCGTNEEYSPLFMELENLATGVQPSQMGSVPSPDRQLYEDSYYGSGDGAMSDEPTHSSTTYSYAVEKKWIEGYIQYINAFDVYASVFQKNGKTYAAMVIILKC